MLRLYCFISGDDYNLLKNDTPASKKKVALLATSLAVPVLIWFIVTILMVSHVLNYSMAAAVVSGVFAASIIFVIERGIIMSNSSKVIGAFRIALGFVVAILGAICLDEVIFKEDIEQQLVKDFQAEVQTELEKVSQQYQEKFSAQEERTRVKYASWQSALDDAKREADGSGGSGAKGVHGITRLKLQIASQNEQDYQAEQTALASMKADIESERTKIKEKLEATSSNHSFLSRIKAMFNLIMNDAWMLMIYSLMTAFFFFLEFLVVIFKMFMDETNYERKVKLIETIGMERMKLIGNNEPRKDAGAWHPKAKKARTMLKDSPPSLFN